MTSGASVPPDAGSVLGSMAASPGAEDVDGGEEPRATDGEPVGQAELEADIARTMPETD